MNLANPQYTMEALLVEELQNHFRRILKQSTNFIGYQGYQDRGTNTWDAYIWVSRLEVPSLEVPRPGIPRLEVRVIQLTKDQA